MEPESSDSSEGSMEMSEEDESSDDDEESSMMSCKSPAEEFGAATQEYRDILATLRDSECNLLQIERIRVLDVVLENVDEICTALSATQSLSLLRLGNSEEERMEIHDGNRAAWTKFFRALGQHDGRITEISLGHNLSGECAAHVIQSFPSGPEIRVSLLWNAISEEDLDFLVKAISIHERQCIVLFLYTADDATGIHESCAAAEPCRIISQLLTLRGLAELSLDSIQFSHDECNELGRILSSSECSARFLSISDCAFSGEGGRFIAEAFRTNTTLQRLILTDVFRDGALRDALIESLPFNSSIRTLELWGVGTLANISNFDLTNIFELLKNIGAHNASIRSLRLDLQLSESEKQQLLPFYHRNCALHCIQFGREKAFQMITKLNKAGRRYLVEDAASKPRCIGVLGNRLVKDDLGCLYFHLRENPILFTSNTSHQRANGKRKAEEAAGHCKTKSEFRASRFDSNGEIKSLHSTHALS